MVRARLSASLARRLLTPDMRRFPTILDQAVQALAPGFVGTDRSTFSLVSRLRVQAWHEVHATRIVNWGDPEANRWRFRKQ